MVGFIIFELVLRHTTGIGSRIHGNNFHEGVLDAGYSVRRGGRCFVPDAADHFHLILGGIVDRGRSDRDGLIAVRGYSGNGDRSSSLADRSILLNDDTVSIVSLYMVDALFILFTDADIATIGSQRTLHHLYEAVVQEDILDTVDGLQVVDTCGSTPVQFCVRSYSLQFRVT